MSVGFYDAEGPYVDGSFWPADRPGERGSETPEPGPRRYVGLLNLCRLTAVVFLFLSLFFTDDIAAVEAFGMAFVGLCCLKG